jgi:peptide deformylase
MGVNKIILSKELLSTPCSSVTALEGEAIAHTLMGILLESETAIGLAANQIGINKRVCIVHVEQPIVLINPLIITKKGSTLFKEGCLSFPGEEVTTQRYSYIEVASANHDQILIFSREKNLLECICVQHEIDHLNGITMHQRRSMISG